LQAFKEGGLFQGKRNTARHAVSEQFRDVLSVAERSKLNLLSVGSPFLLFNEAVVYYQKSVSLTAELDWLG